MAWTIVREHSICCGHRVFGHEGKCKYLHGHEYKFRFAVEAEELDDIGRVIDFSVIKDLLCQWLEDYWDHKFLLWTNDPIVRVFQYISNDQVWADRCNDPVTSLYLLPVNPTVENIAAFFVDDIAPKVLKGTNVKLVELQLWETSKCSAIYRAGENVKTSKRNEGTVSRVNIQEASKE